MIKPDIKAIADYLDNTNPYPEDIFPEPSYEDWHLVGKFLNDHGKNGDRIFAKWGRMVWQNCVNQLRDFEQTEVK